MICKVSQGAIAVLVLAGDRTANDPVRLAANASCKALVSVAGQPMLLRVLEALAVLDSVERITLCGPSKRAVGKSPALQRWLQRGDVVHLEAEASLSASVAAGLRQGQAHERLLLTTADNALLDAEILAHFLQSCEASEADFCIGMVKYETLRQQYPGVRRTVLKFSDTAYCGCNLYFIKTAAGRGVIDHWQATQQDRKTPWRMVSKLGGVSMLLRYLLGRLSVPAACHALSERTGIKIILIDVPFARAGIDVDTAADHRLVEEILQHR